MTIQGVDLAFARVRVELGEQVERFEDQRDDRREAAAAFERQRLEAMRDAVDDRLVAGIVEGIGVGLGGVFTMAGSCADTECVQARWTAAGEFAGGAGKIGATVWSADAGSRDIEGESFALRSKIEREDADSLEKTIERTQRRVESTMQTIATIERERMESRMIVVRG